MLLIRVALPSRPGALGALASALGSIGADINLVEIVAKERDAEVDELILDLPAGQTVEALVAACDALDGVHVQWVRNYPRGGGLEYDIELHRRMVADPGRAGEILVSAAPLVFRADWSVLLDVSRAPRVLFRTPDAPELAAEELERCRPFDRTHRVEPDPAAPSGAVPQHAVVAPMPGDLAVVVGRRGEPAFFRSELARLDHLAGGSGGLDTEELPDPALASRHRHPIAPPLYSRDDSRPSGSSG